MEIVFLILSIIAALCAVPAYFIGSKTYKSLVKSQNKNAKTYGILAGTVSFIVILVVVVFLVIINIPFHR